MTVAELIAHLQQLPQDLQVIVPCWSEQCLLEADKVYVSQEGVARGDGWVANKRPDQPIFDYVVIGP